MPNYLSAILNNVPNTNTNTSIAPAKSTTDTTSLKQQLGYINPNTDPNNPFAQTKNPNNSIATDAGMTARAVGQGVSQLVDVGQSTAEQIANTQGIPKIVTDLIPNNIASNVVDKLSNAIGLPKPLTNNEKLASSALSTATQFAVPIGGEAKLGDMALNAVAGAASGAAQEGVKQSGGSDLAQQATGLLVGASGLITGHLIASKFGDNIAKVVNDVTPDKVFTKDGTLTDEGQDIVAQTGTDEHTLKQAYNDAVTETDQHYANIKSNLDDAVAQGLPTDHPVVQQAQDMLDQIDAKKAEVESKINAPEDYQDVNPITRSPDQKIQDAQDLNVPLTTGQITNDPVQLGKESKLIGREDSIGQEAANIRENQIQAVNNAGDNLVQSFNNSSLDKEQKGQMIQSALTSIKNDAYSNVKDLYQKLSTIKDAPIVDGTNFANHAFEVLDQLPENDTRSQQLFKELGRYNLIPPEYVEQKTYDPIFKQTKLALKNGETIKFKGEQKDLTLANADQLNQSINKMYDGNKQNPQIALKKTLKDSMLNTIEKVGNENSQAGKLALQTQQEYRDYNKTFKSKDIINSLTENKVGTETPKISPDRVMDLILGPKDNIVNVKKLKAMLLSNPETKNAWELIKSHALGNMLKESLDTSGNLSASKLNSRIHKMGTAKLKLLFDPSEYNNLMKLNRVAQDAVATGKGMSMPVKNHLINMIYHGSKFALLGLGHGATHLASLVMFGLGDSYEKIKINKEAMETLEAMKDYKGNHSKVSIDDPRLSIDRLKSLLDYTTSKEFIQPIMQSTMANIHKDKKDNQ